MDDFSAYSAVTKERTRASKESRMAAEAWFKQAELNEKEERTKEFLAYALSRVERPVVSCSFGIDSITVVHLTRQIREDVEVVWNNTLNEFPDTQKFARELTQAWGLRLVEAKPQTTLKQVYAKYLDTHDPLRRKGDRREGKQALTEICCKELKHKPMKRCIKEHGWDLVINGLRADESRQRWMAARRDGEFFYSNGEWKSYVARPILFWTNDDVWAYQRKHSLPYNPLYDKGVEGYEKVRTGCMMCPIPIKHGYLEFLRLQYPKVYDAMLYKFGFAKILLLERLKDEDVVDELTAFGVLREFTDETVEELVRSITEFKPCIFDKFN